MKENKLEKPIWLINICDITDFFKNTEAGVPRIIVISVWSYSYSKCSETNVNIKERMADWTVVSRGSMKKFLVVTVTYVITNIPLYFGQPQPLLFLKNGLQLLKGKALEMIHKCGRTEAQSWP